jgi:hypothetical protein
MNTKTVVFVTADSLNVRDRLLKVETLVLVYAFFCKRLLSSVIIHCCEKSYAECSYCSSSCPRAASLSQCTDYSHYMIASGDESITEIIS